MLRDNEGVRRPALDARTCHLMMGVANCATPICEIFSTNFSQAAIRENLDP